MPTNQLLLGCRTLSQPVIDVDRGRVDLSSMGKPAENRRQGKRVRATGKADSDSPRRFSWAVAQARSHVLNKSWLAPYRVSGLVSGHFLPPRIEWERGLRCFVVVATGGFEPPAKGL